jgi:hypothetical protein
MPLGCGACAPVGYKYVGRATAVPPVLKTGFEGRHGAPSLGMSPSSLSSSQGVSVGLAMEDDDVVVVVSSHGVLVDELIGVVEDDIIVVVFQNMLVKNTADEVVVELQGMDQSGNGGGVGASVTVIVCVGDPVLLALTVRMLSIVVASVCVVDGAEGGVYDGSELPSTFTIENCGRAGNGSTGSAVEYLIRLDSRKR